MKRWQRFVASLATATLIYGGQLRQWTDPRNRFLDHWERRDALAILGGIAVLALLAWALREMVARFGPARRVLDHAFLLIFGGALISTFLTYDDYKTELLYIGLAALATFSWCRPALRLPARLATLALIVSPLYFIMAKQLLGFGEWHTPREAPHASQPVRDAQPVFLFVFDEWSWERSTRCGELLPLFKNLRAFADGATTFSQGRSPGPRTDVSLPRFIFQTTADLHVTDHEAFYETAGQRLPTITAPSIFSLAREHGYNTNLLGFYLPYRQLLGAQVDYTLAFNIEPKSDSLAGLAMEHALSNLNFQRDPISRHTTQFFGPRSREKYSTHWDAFTRNLRQTTLGMIDQSSANTLSLIHFPVPHCPFVFNADGTFRGPYRGSKKAHDPEGYERHLAFLDLLIGEFISRLRATGKYDRSLIVITSDHSWRQDYEYDGVLRDGDGLRHVPLFIKLPGQTEPKRIDSTTELTTLRPLLDAVLRGESGESSLPLSR